MCLLAHPRPLLLLRRVAGCIRHGLYRSDAPIIGPPGRKLAFPLPGAEPVPAATAVANKYMGAPMEADLKGHESFPTKRPCLFRQVSPALAT